MTFPQAHGAIFHVQAMGIPWAMILTWLEEYGFPAVLKVLQALVAANLHGVSLQQIIAWIVSALIAVAGGNPLPPLPKPTP